jgi:hypothetical protein
MRQLRLFASRTGPQRAQNAKSAKKGYDEANIAAARIILEDVARYGEGSGAVQWARACLKRLGATPRPRFKPPWRKKGKPGSCKSAGFKESTRSHQVTNNPMIKDNRGRAV